MNLIVDAGNTSVKLAVYKGKQLIFSDVVVLKNFLDLVKETFLEYPDIKDAIVSSVGHLGEDEITKLAVYCNVHTLSVSTKIPFKNLYSTPKTLGVDRIALATAAFYNNTGNNTLVIDAGTCVTYDFINENGAYLGGAISPGVAMRFKAMHNQTAKLPLLDKNGEIELIGNSTTSCIKSGVINGICLEIDGVIKEYKVRFADLTVILTGGDAHFLSKRLKNTIFAHSNFLLDGLNYLLEYNKD
ncbi:type III pantothenate kinase [Cellulophaga omnivescoria]|uniref:type III pantothenate kinase n=1 Tax=Cellulophaga omnivescoria TaxID=1888890 RepID=UPI0022F0D2C0|nr:type III pantothenate kinase [Cellulophaga omnivescoria]WBU90177.1 type III pantothenate kinase [Cellulophaga omnivescoria]